VRERALREHAQDRGGSRRACQKVNSATPRYAR
jgi:hypothetical protein